MVAPRPCAACSAPIPRHYRKRYCSPDCAAHDKRPGPRRFAYADPPYPGQAHLYRHHHDYAGEVDHRELVDRLVADFPDGWALSTSSLSLRDVWALCPPETRLGLWMKGFSPMKPTVSVQFAWEAVLFWRGRPREPGGDLVRDWIMANPAAWRVEGGVIGMKPRQVCDWIFRLLGAEPGDELVDLYPGSGAVGRAWEAFQQQQPIVRRSRRSELEQTPLW